MKTLELNIQDECTIVNALNAHWNDAHDNLKRSDLGDMEREQYEIQLNKSKQLLIYLDAI